MSRPFYCPRCGKDWLNATQGAMCPDCMTSGRCIGLINEYAGPAITQGAWACDRCGGSADESARVPHTKECNDNPVPRVVRRVAPGPAITQGPDDVGDAQALRDADTAQRSQKHGDGIGDAPTHREPSPARPTLSRMPGELAMELLRYASANAPGGQLARPLTAYETHLAAHLAAFLHHSLRQAALALEGNDDAAGDALKLAMQAAKSADAARRVVIHEDAIRQGHS